MTDYARQHHFRNIMHFVDDGYSGTNFDRPDFRRMERMIENGEIGTVIVKDMSRLGRNYLQVGMYTDMVFPENDVRFIAINDNVDSDVQTEFDMTPIRNFCNELYARDAAKKVRCTLRMKGESGKPLTTKPPYGFHKSPEDKDTWIVDETAAEVVRRIFKLCVGGNGPAQIADILTNDKVPTPTEYWISRGQKAGNLPAVPGRWVQTCVADMLERQEYVGDTVNFRYTTKSFKNKARVHIPEENWKIFENTHPAIIDRETFKLVQELREHRRRPTRSGIVSMFSGTLYCADCGEKLYYSVTNNYKREQAYFFCSAYRKNSEVCSAHYIREVVVEKLVLANMQRVFNFVQLYEKQFAEAQMANYGEEQKKALAEKRKAITKAKKRITEIDGLIQKIYARGNGRSIPKAFRANQKQNGITPRLCRNYEQILLN